LLASIAAVAAGAVVARNGRAGATPPRETGLSHEGLLAGRAGFQPRTTMSLPKEELPGFLSKEQLALHHADYASLVERLRDTDRALQQGGADASAYAKLRRTQVTTANGVLLHELYFTGLAPAKAEPPQYIVSHVSEHMGEWQSWQDDFRQCALVAKAWAALVYDPYDDRWHNTVMDSEDEGVWIGANPLVVCDVSAHAYSRDYKSRNEYVAKFLEHIDWEEVARRYSAVDRM
jgi:superoxide dismutase